MSLKLRPYWKDRTRHEVDMQIDHPITELPLRKRVAAPAGFDERQARRWGEKELEKWLKSLSLPTPREEDRKDAQPAKPVPRAELTFEGFYRERFEPNYVRFQRPATQTGYDSLWRNHLSALGPTPLRALDTQAIDKFKRDLADKGLEPTTINLILGKLKKMLRWALARKDNDGNPLIAGLPLIERVKTNPTPRPHYSEEQINALRANFGKRLINVCRTVFRGQEGPAKGTIGEVGVTDALLSALSRLERRGPRVLYRCSQHTGWEYAGHSEHSVAVCLNRIQREVGFDKTGLHILRHSGITYLADQGEDIYTVQAFARHARLQTTQAYLHQSKQRLASKAARAFDGNRPATPGN